MRNRVDINKNQHGFGSVVLIVIFVIVSVSGFAGWWVYSTKTPNKEVIGQSSDNQESDINVTLKNPDDVDKLPLSTPDSFKVYMQKLLKEPNPCNKEYSVYSVSENVIRGGVRVSPGLSSDGMTVCGSGAPFNWVLQPDGEWTLKSVQ